MKRTSTLKKIIATCFILPLTIGLNTSYGTTGADTQTNCVPPVTTVPGGPEYVAQFHATYSDGTNIYNLSNPEHFGFTGCDTPPTQAGATTVHSFGSTVKAGMAVNNGASQSLQGPAQVTVRMTKTGGADPSTGTYDTEMLQLDLQGGNLPAGVMIRESPTLQSTGQTSITHNGSGYHIDSFFDIFTELSVDGGASWHPSTAGPGHMVLTTPNAVTIPTMNQWGLIIFSMLMLVVIMGFVRKGQIA